jgi:hypothetical protein
MRRVPTAGSVPVPRDLEMPAMSAVMLAETPGEVAAALEHAFPDGFDPSSVPICGHTPMDPTAMMHHAMGPAASLLAGLSAVLCARMAFHAAREGQYANAVRMGAMGGRDLAMLVATVAGKLVGGAGATTAMAAVPVLGVIAGAAGLVADYKTWRERGGVGPLLAMLGDGMMLTGSALAPTPAAPVAAVIAGAGMGTIAAGLLVDWLSAKLEQRGYASPVVSE